MAEQVCATARIFFLHLPPRDSSKQLEKLFFKCLTKSTDREYVRKSKPYKLSQDQSAEAKDKYLRRRVDEVMSFLTGRFPAEEDTSKLEAEVVRRMARRYKLLCLKENEMLLEVEELVTLRDLCGMGSNAMYRFKSGLEALRPVLNGLILPNCVKARIATFERSGNLPVNTVLQQVIVSSNDGTLRQMRPHMYLLQPWILAELLVDKSILDLSFQLSEEFMTAKYNGVAVFTFNIDKSGTDINCSLRLVNRKGGNSSEHTHPMAITEGPISECYENERQTLFRYVTGPFLQLLVDDSCQMFNAQLPGQSQTIMFRPTPDAGRCIRRQIRLEQAEDLTVSERSVSLSPLPEDGPPAVEIPVGKSLTYRFVVKHVEEEDDAMLVVGVQFLVDGRVALTQNLSSAEARGNGRRSDSRCSVAGHRVPCK